MPTHDVIVLGLGGLGSATTLSLARRGARVLGLERHALAHDLGSSHGQTRIIRKAYFEHPDYVPLLERAYAGWRALEEETSARLYVPSGLLLTGPETGTVVGGTLRAAAAHGLPLERLNPDEIRRRFPDFSPHDDVVGVYEADAGYLRVEACVRAACDAAARLGADLRPHTPALGWAADGDGVRVVAGDQTWTADRLVVAAGAWAPGLLPTLRPALHVQRQVQLWFEAHPMALGPGYPVFGVETEGSFFYGFPAISPGEVKVCEHGGGAPVSDPGALDRTLHPEDVTRVAAFTRAWLRGVSPRVARHAACMYTMSPDQHFLIDRLPQHPQVIVAAGMSGHGFKFAAGLGEALADLALLGATDQPIGFLSVSRPDVGAV